MNPPPLRDLFPDEDYRHYLKLQTGSPAEFFAPSSRHGELTQQRAGLLTQFPARHAACLPGAGALIEETIACASEWNSISAAERTELDRAATPAAKCAALGRAWEVDFMILERQAAGSPRLAGGCICFPSSWSFEEKLGHELPFIHDVVPGLNDALVSPINTFLNKLRPGVAFLRHNWGLSRWPDLNQHPALGLTRLQPPLKLDDVWLRIEHQALVALPRRGGILFGIAMHVHPLAAVKADAEAARRFHRALATMPEDMARYKSIAAARDELLRLLAD